MEILRQDEEQEVGQDALHSQAMLGLPAAAIQVVVEVGVAEDTEAASPADFYVVGECEGLAGEAWS